MAISDKLKWVGIRPTDPAENIPVDVKAVTGNVPIIPSTPPQNIPVDVKTVTGNTPIIPASPEKIFTYREHPEGTTYIKRYCTVSGNTVPLYNVAGGETLYLTDFTLITIPLAAGRVRIYVQDDGDNYLYDLVGLLCVINVGQFVSHTFGTADIIEGGYDIIASSDTINCHGNIFITGYTR